MRKKVLTLLLSLTSSCCFVGGLVACKDKSDGEPTRVEQVDKVELLDSNITLKIGDVYKLKTSDGVEYYTFTSDNADVCSVSTSGQLTAKSVGVANITVNTPTGKLTCVVTVETEIIYSPSYYVALNAPETVRVGNELAVQAIVYEENEIKFTKSKCNT